MTWDLATCARRLARSIWPLAIVATVLFSGPFQARAQQIDLPTIPDPVPVTLDPRTTALVISDLTPQNCPNSPSCLDAMAPLAGLLARARAAGVFIAHTTGGGGLAAAGFMPEVAPMPGEPVIVRPGPGTGTWWGEVDDMLAERGIDTVIIVGSQAAGIVLQGAFWASYVKGYTVVAPVDGMPSPSEFRLLYTEFQVLNQPGGRQNPNNNPLEPGSTTLSRTDLISFR